MNILVLGSGGREHQRQDTEGRYHPLASAIGVAGLRLSSAPGGRLRVRCLVSAAPVF